MNISPPDDHLDTLLLEGFNSGDPIPVDAEFWTELKCEAMAKLELRKKMVKVDRSQL